MSVRKKKIEPAPAAAAFAPKLYVVFYYEDKNGNSGFDNVVMTGLVDYRTQNEIADTMAKIKSLREPDFYAHLTIMNWHLLQA